MAATTAVRECNGSAPTTAAVTGLAFCTSDVWNPGTNYPIPLPPSGSNYSFTKVVYLNAVTTPDTLIDNVVVYSDGTNSLGTGVSMYIGTSEDYQRSTGLDAVSGDPSSIAVSNIFDYTDSTPLEIGGSLSNPDTGRVSDYIYIQLVVSSTASAGNVGSETIVIGYDES
jgi:hypothetical protein